MTRSRALAAAALVAAVVFYALAAPLLRELFGPLVVVPAYLAVALLAGAATYRAVLLVSRLADRTDEEELEGPVQADDLEDVVAEEDVPGPDVEAELEDLGADRATEAESGAGGEGGE